MASFVTRAIDVTITLGVPTVAPGQPIPPQPVFSSGKNTLTLKGHRVSCSITIGGSSSQPFMVASIYGMTMSDMNAIASFGQPQYLSNNNKITILAGDSVSGMPQAFIGTLLDAYVDFTQTPEVCLTVSGFAGARAALAPIAPNSFRGAISVSTIMGVLASAAGFTLENNGVTAVLSNAYFPGSALDQIKSCARAANINWTIDGEILAIWPKNGSRGNKGIPLISPATTLKGYPSYTANGINFTTLYIPGLVYGALVDVQSSLQNATGQWSVFSLTHTLESITKGGAWFSDVVAFNPLKFAAIPSGPSA
jgi:hypothetical protein